MKKIIDIDSYLYDDLWELLLDMREHLLVSGETYAFSSNPYKLHYGWKCSSHWLGISLMKLKTSLWNPPSEGVNLHSLHQYFKDGDGQEALTAILNNPEGEDDLNKMVNRLVKLRTFA